MTVYEVYIGKLSNGEDPLDWGGDWNIGNTPAAVSPFFPPEGGGYMPRWPFYRLIDKIEKGEYSGKKIDWGAYAARVSKKQILDFIAETYGSDNWYTDPTKMPHLYERLQGLIICVESLPDNQDFALVVREF